MRKKERFVLGKRTFRSQKSKHFVLRIILSTLGLHMIMVTMCVDTRMLFVGIMHVTTAGVRSVHILSFFYLCFLYYLVLLTQHQQVECHNRHACYQTIDSMMVLTVFFGSG